MKELLSKYREGIRFHPARGHEFNRETGNYEKKSPKLEKTVTAVMAGLAIVFLMNNISLSGFVINANANLKSSVSAFSIIGFSLLFVALCGLIIARIRKLRLKRV